MTDLSTKPYLIRAIYEWCADAGFTPYLSVKVDANTRVPMEYVKAGEIVLSISQQATRDLTIGNDVVQFSARFNGVSREVSVPIYAVQGVFARENGRGVFFDPETPPDIDDADASSSEGTTQIAARTPASRTPTLQAVPQTAALVDQPTDGDLSQGAKSTDPELPDSPDKPDKPKGPPRGNLRIIK
jgi:stringent starvation protein B